jgi:hypothetical protein
MGEGLTEAQPASAKDRAHSQGLNPCEDDATEAEKGGLGMVWKLW